MEIKRKLKPRKTIKRKLIRLKWIEILILSKIRLGKLFPINLSIKIRYKNHKKKRIRRLLVEDIITLVKY